VNAHEYARFTTYDLLYADGDTAEAQSPTDLRVFVKEKDIVLVDWDDMGNYYYASIVDVEFPGDDRSGADSEEASSDDDNASIFPLFEVEFFADSKMGYGIEANRIKIPKAKKQPVPKSKRR
jgi:hypothetical protein